MRLAIVNLTGGGLSGGYLKYLRRLLPELARHPRIGRLQVFLPPGFVSLLEGVIPAADCLPCRDSIAGRLGLRRQLRQLAPEVIFFPSYRCLDIRGIPTVSMIRNMEPLLIPFGGNRWSDATRNLLRRRSARKACRQADRVIAVSDFVKDFLMESWGIDPAKIGVVYHGVDGPPPREASVRPASLQDLGEGPFIFTAGSIRPARGLEDLIRALPLLEAQGIHWPLVIAGGIHGAAVPHQKRITTLARQLGVEGKIFWAGELNLAEISWCYHQSGVFVMTSRVEACPNIALEALSHGCLTIAADNPPLPEIFRDCCTYYPPRDSAALAGEIVATLSEGAEQTDARRRRAQERAQEFSWSRTVEQTIKELGLAARGSQQSTGPEDASSR